MKKLKTNPNIVLYLLILILTITNIILFIFLIIVINDKGNDYNWGDDITVEEVTNRVGKLIYLNNDEKPTMATIEDIDTLKALQPDIYKNTKNNDVILVYSDRVIVYRPSENIIITVISIDRYQDE